MNYENYMTLRFFAKSENESFARSAVAAFAAQLDPTVTELTEIRTAVSEAVTNAVIYAYEDENNYIDISCGINDNTVFITVEDKGRGIVDINQAMEVAYTSKADEERAGMGFTIMQSFMDEISVESAVSQGTKVNMRKVIKAIEV